MQFVNPLELLDIGYLNVDDINGPLIKKLKRKILADIELSENNEIYYHERPISKELCEKFISELESKEKIEFYKHLFENNSLNNFLVKGEDSLFIRFKHESIYKLPNFVKLISPYFAFQFKRLSITYFVNGDEVKLRSLFSLAHLMIADDYHGALIDISKEIDSRIGQIENLTEDLNNDRISKDHGGLDVIVSRCKDLFPVDLLNSLPKYFQSQLNKVAIKLNLLQLAIWNNYNSTEQCLEILEHLLKLNLESSKREVIFEKNYRIIKKKHIERLEQEINAPVLKQYASHLLVINQLNKDVEDKSIESLVALELTRVKLQLEIPALNGLPSYANEIRNQISLAVRRLSITCWNSYNDLKSAMALNSLASTISVDDDVKSKLLQDLNDFRELESKYKDSLVCFFCSKNPPESSASFKIKLYKENKRTYFPRRSVEFSYVEVTIPRCTDCKSLHTAKESLLSTQNLVAVILGGLGALIFNDSPFVGGISGLVVGWIIGDLVDQNNLNKSKVKSTAFSKLSEYTVVKERLQDGWSLSRPIA